MRTERQHEDGERKRGCDREVSRKEVPKRANKDENLSGMKSY